MTNRNNTRNGNGPLVALGSLSNIATLIVIVAAAIGLAQKLDSLESRAAQNCRGINAAIILTLESTRTRAERQGRGKSLDRTIDRFTKLAEAC